MSKSLLWKNEGVIKLSCGEPASWSWRTALGDAGTYLRICHLTSPFKATIQFLTEARNPCALLNEPLEAHNVAALKWWLLSWHKASIVLQKATSYATPATQWPWWAQVSKVGFHVGRSHPLLCASPDGGSSCGQLYAFVEVKWPYSHHIFCVVTWNYGRIWITFAKCRVRWQ